MPATHVALLKAVLSLSLWLALLVPWVACAGPSALSGGDRGAFNARYAHTEVELKVSCYYGDLYDDNEKWLLSPYPFAHTSHIVDLHGAPIHPKNQQGILPAGTRFTVDQVEFPGGFANVTRMLTTPRFNPWMVLQRIPQEASPQNNKPFVMVLPGEDAPTATLTAHVDQMLGPVGSVQAWLATVRPTVAVAIRHKELVPGMNPTEMNASMGPPLRWFREPATADAPAAQVAWYPVLEAWLVGDAITQIKPPRPPPEVKRSLPNPEPAAPSS